MKWFNKVVFLLEQMGYTNGSFSYPGSNNEGSCGAQGPPDHQVHAERQVSKTSREIRSTRNQAHTFGEPFCHHWCLSVIAVTFYKLHISCKLDRCQQTTEYNCSCSQ